MRQTTRALNSSALGVTLFFFALFPDFLPCAFAKGPADRNFSAQSAASINKETGLPGLIGQVEKLSAAGDYEAVEQMRLTHPELGKSPQALECFAFADQDVRNWKVAMSEFNEAARLAPKDVHIQTSLVYGLYGMGDQREALFHVNRIIAEHPKEARARAIQALVLQQLGSAKEASVAMKQAEQIGMSFPVWEAKYNFAIGNLDAAQTIKAADDCLKAAPNDVRVLMFHGRAMRNAGKISVAESDFQKLLKASPNHMAALSLLAETYRLDGKYKQAIACLEARLKLAKTQREMRIANGAIAEICEKSKDIPGAADARERMIALAVQRKKCEDSAQMKDILLCCHDLMELKRWQPAADRLSLVLARFPNSSQAMEKRAQCYAKLNKNAEALEDFNNLIAKDGDVASWYRERADVLKRVGRAADAQKDLKQAQSLEAAQKAEEAR